MTSEWLFDPPPPSQSRRGGSGNLEVFSRDLDSLIRELLQNASDQKRPDQDGVRVRLAVEDISGPDLDLFLKAAGWPNLRDHVEAVGERDYVTTSPRVRRNLDRLDNERSLRLFRIEDIGTCGLTGDEDDHSANFNLLCRDELISPGQRRQSGGSYGIGKFVLWLFSGLYTVLFSSGLQGANGDIRQRFFGRALLPFHETGDRAWDGSGWLGRPEDTGSGARAVSIFDQEAESTARGCRLERPADEAGTSILIVGFDEPAEEVPRPIEDICSDMVRSAALWFWPALVRRNMDVLVEGYRDGRNEFSQHVHPTAEVTPFVLATTESAEVTELAREPGDVAERELEIQVPAQRHMPGIGNPRGPVTGKAALRVRVAESGERAWVNTIALQRGTGMVVKYMEQTRRSLGEVSFHAVLLAGLAHGSDDANHAVEEFLRAAEPPTHNDWAYGTERLKAEYLAGARTAFDKLKSDIATALRELTREDIAESSDGPDKLRQLFPMPGIGAPTTTREPYRLTGAEATLTDSTWGFHGTFARARTGEKEDWRFRVAVVLDQETGGAGAASQRLAIQDLSARPSAHGNLQTDGSFEIEVPAGVDEVTFRGLTEPIEDLPPGGLHRVRVSLDVRALTGRRGG
jgi:hypothetical protein